MQPSSIRHYICHFLKQDAVLPFYLRVPVCYNLLLTFENLFSFCSLLEVFVAHWFVGVDLSSHIRQLLAVDLVGALVPSLHQDLATGGQHTPIHYKFK